MKIIADLYIYRCVNGFTSLRFSSAIFVTDKSIKLQ